MTFSLDSDTGNDGRLRAPRLLLRLRGHSGWGILDAGGPPMPVASPRTSLLVDTEKL